MLANSGRRSASYEWLCDKTSMHSDSLPSAECKVLNSCFCQASGTPGTTRV